MGKIIDYAQHPLVKIIIAGSLILLLVETGALDISNLKDLMLDKTYIIVSIIYWIFIPVVMAWYRWHCIIPKTVASTSTFRAHMIGLFFNSAIPGAFGGDGMKVLTLKDEKIGVKDILGSLFTDRISGGIGLFAFGFAAALCASPGLQLTANVIIILTGTGILALSIGTRIAPRLNDVALKNAVFSTVTQIIAKIMPESPKAFPKSVGLSFLIHSCTGYYFYFLTSLTSNRVENIADLFLGFFSVGVAIALPIAPSGLGVGHYANELTFSQIGINNGALIFSLFAFGQIALNCIGAIFYLFGSQKRVSVRIEAVS